MTALDTRKLSDLLRAGLLTPVYHGGPGVCTLRALGRSHLTITKDLTRVMNRLKGLYRNWAILCAGQQVYSPRHRAASDDRWFAQRVQPGLRRGLSQLFQAVTGLAHVLVDPGLEIFGNGSTVGFRHHLVAITG